MDSDDAYARLLARFCVWSAQGGVELFLGRAGASAAEHDEAEETGLVAGLHRLAAAHAFLRHDGRGHPLSGVRLSPGGAPALRNRPKCSTLSNLGLQVDDSSGRGYDLL